MVPIITRHWWALVLRGVIALILGILAVGVPGLTFELLAIFVAAYLVIDGIFAIVAGVRAAENHRRWWPFALEGVIDIVAGAIVYAAPAVLIGIMAFWAIVTGLVLLIPAFSLPAGAGKWVLVLDGALSVLFGIVILAQPVAGILFVAFAVGIYAIFFGIGLIILGLRVRRLHTSRTDLTV